MKIKRIGSQPFGQGPAEWFTGTVRIDPLFSLPNPARTAWHTHPLGQILDWTEHVSDAQYQVI